MILVILERYFQMSEKKYEIGDFQTEEISQIRLYIDKHVPHMVLNNLYILTDTVEDKCVSFIGIYRILNSCKNYTPSKTQDKINYFLNKSKNAYEEIYPLIQEYKHSYVNYGKERILQDLGKILIKHQEIVNKLIDLFVVLGEEIELMKTDAIIGIEAKKDDDFSERLIKGARKIAQEEGA